MVKPSPGVSMMSKGLSKSGGFYGSRCESTTNVEPRNYTTSQLVVSEPHEKDFEVTGDIGFADVNRSRNLIRAHDCFAHRLLVTEEKQFGFQSKL